MDSVCASMQHSSRFGVAVLASLMVRSMVGLLLSLVSRPVMFMSVSPLQYSIAFTSLSANIPCSISPVAILLPLLYLGMCM